MTRLDSGTVAVGHPSDRSGVITSDQVGLPSDLVVGPF